MGTTTLNKATDRTIQHFVSFLFCMLLFSCSSTVEKKVNKSLTVTSLPDVIDLPYTIQHPLNYPFSNTTCIFSIESGISLYADVQDDTCRLLYDSRLANYIRDYKVFSEALKKIQAQGNYKYVEFKNGTFSEYKKPDIKFPYRYTLDEREFAPVGDKQCALRLVGGEFVKVGRSYGCGGDLMWHLPSSPGLTFNKLNLKQGGLLEALLALKDDRYSNTLVIKDGVIESTSKFIDKSLSEYRPIKYSTLQDRAEISIESGKYAIEYDDSYRSGEFLFYESETELSSQIAKYGAPYVATNAFGAKIEVDRTYFDVVVFDLVHPSDLLQEIPKNRKRNFLATCAESDGGLRLVGSERRVHQAWKKGITLYGEITVTESDRYRQTDYASFSAPYDYFKKITRVTFKLESIHSDGIELTMYDSYSC